MIKQEIKDGFLTVFVTLIEILTVFRTALDTYTVSGDLLNVILIDGAMFTFWQIIRFAGNSAKALALRPIAAGLAWALYLMQIAIGVEAHHDWVVIAVRVAGGGLLALDTWGYLVSLRQKIAQGRKHTDTHTDWRAQLRASVSGVSYAVIAVCLLPVAALLQGVIAFVNYLRDVNLKVVPANTHTPVLVDSKQRQAQTTRTLKGNIEHRTVLADTQTQTVDAEYADTQAGVAYTHTDDGLWIWECVCGASSQTQTRGQTHYPSVWQAQKAYGGHTGSQAHRQKILSAKVSVD